MFKQKGGGGAKAFWTMLKKLHFSYTMASLKMERKNQENIVKIFRLRKKIYKKMKYSAFEWDEIRNLFAAIHQ